MCSLHAQDEMNRNFLRLDKAPSRATKDIIQLIHGCVIHFDI